MVMNPMGSQSVKNHLKRKGRKTQPQPISQQLEFPNSRTVGILHGACSELWTFGLLVGLSFIGLVGMNRLRGSYSCCEIWLFSKLWCGVVNPPPFFGEKTHTDIHIESQTRIFQNGMSEQKPKEWLRPRLLALCVSPRACVSSMMGSVRLIQNKERWISTMNNNLKLHVWRSKSVKQQLNVRWFANLTEHLSIHAPLVTEGWYSWRGGTLIQHDWRHPVIS